MNKVNDNLFINVANLAALFYANGKYTTLTTDGNYTDINDDVFEELASALDSFKIDNTLFVNPACVVFLEKAQGKNILTLLGSRKLELTDAQYIAVSGISGALEVTDITALTTAQLDGLKPGNTVLKKTEDMAHTYVVSYKEEKHGICLTYVDASVAETVSYDYVEDAWVYNSTDSTPLTH